VDARRVRDHSPRPLPRLHHRKARGNGWIAGPHRGDGVRCRVHDSRSAQGARPQTRPDVRERSGLRQRRAVRHPALPAARRQGDLRLRGTMPIRCPIRSAARTVWCSTNCSA
jgi:hypothetical protein